NPGVTQAWKRMTDLALTIGDIESARSAFTQVLGKVSDSKEAEKQAPLVLRLLHAMPDDKEMHELALQFFKSTGNSAKAAEEYLWLVHKEVEAGHEQQAEALLEEALL